MQSPAAAVRGSHAAAGAAVASLKMFSRKYNTKQVSEFPQALATSSSAAAGEDGKKASLVADGKLNFHVRKRRQPAVIAVNKSDESASLVPNSPLNIGGDLAIVANVQASQVETSTAVISSLNDSPSVFAATAAGTKTSSRRRSARLKRVAEEEQSLAVENLGAAELKQSRSSKSRRVSTKTVVTAKSKPLLSGTGPPPATSSLLQENSATDFWHSSLSETSGAPVIKDLVEAAVLPIVAGKALSAPEEIAAALKHLKSADPLLKMVIEMHEGPKFEKSKSAFSSLARSIVFQQLATKAAATIFGRLVTLCEGLDELTPTTISQLTAQQLRAVGISERKASYLHDLAANFLSGALSDSSINDMDDEALMKALTAVKGIGVWSVHMFMLFSLHRPDVLPVGDLGVRKGFQKLYELDALPTPAQAEQIASRWQPYRSLGSWYMWRVVNNSLPLKQSD